MTPRTLFEMLGGISNEHRMLIEKFDEHMAEAKAIYDDLSKNYPPKLPTRSTWEYCLGHDWKMTVRPIHEVDIDDE